MAFAFACIFIAQCFYTVADVFQKKALLGGFSLHALTRPAFLMTMGISFFGFLFQMYALSKIELSRTVITLGVLGAIMAAAAGVIIFHDKLSVKNYVGIAFAIAAIVLVRSK